MEDGLYTRPCSKLRSQLPQGPDEELMPPIDLANIACGFHGGDPVIMHKTVKLAKKYGVPVGAHPSLPDREGFGRRNIAISAEDLLIS